MSIYQGNFVKKICVVGLGSISKRHIRNLRKIYPEIEIDILRHGKDETVGVESEYGREVYSYSELRDRYDAVFITNPTTMHLKTLQEMLGKSDAFFIEKPLRPLRDSSCDKYIFPENKICYVACPMRYTRIIKWIKDNIDLTSVYSIRAISSSYLPDWRPGTDYTKCYSARRDLGGGVAADLIHEWDYISYLFGRPEAVHKVERKLSSLDIDVEDIAIYIGEYKDKVAEVQLDYFGRSTRRSLEMITKEDTVICDFVVGKITYLKSGKIVELPEERDDHQTAELEHFFDIVEGKITNDSSAEEAEKLLELLEG